MTTVSLPEATSEKDKQFLRRALQFAAESIGLASPNPYVGAVVVKDGVIVGSGTHAYEGRKHGEILALEEAGTRASGATLYVNLEPCSHQGRTGPCADAVVAAGIRRVVCSMEDPNPKVKGQGFAKLRAAGIELAVGLLENEARRLNEAFVRYVRSRRPLVTLKSAMTSDGKIAPATRTPENRWITGEAARTHVQQLRHQSDAILVGVGTVVADDPLLTDRSGMPRRRSLMRVILDSQLRLPLDSRLVTSAQGDVVAFCKTGASRKSELARHGIRIEEVNLASEDLLDWNGILARLGELQILSLMIEGGSHINGSALAAGIVDKVFLYQSPRAMNDANAVPFATWPDGHTSLGIANLRDQIVHRFGDDSAVEGYLHDPYQD